MPPMIAAPSRSRPPVVRAPSRSRPPVVPAPLSFPPHKPKLFAPTLLGLLGLGPALILSARLRLTALAAPLIVTWG